MWFSFPPMSEHAAASSLPPRSRVVRPITRAAERPCARPGCPGPARATLVFAYAAREAVLDRLSDAADPQSYDLCAVHAGRTEPPRGWSLNDRRPEEDRALPPTSRREPRDLGGDATVAVLAAALRAVPDVPPEPDLPTAEVAALEGEQMAVEAATEAVGDPPTNDVAHPPVTLPGDVPPVPVPRPVPAALDRGLPGR